MATAFTSSEVATTVPARGGIGLIESSSSYDLAAALVINDTISMVKLPTRAIVKDIILSTPDLDSDGSPAVVLAVGDSVDDDRFITGSTVGQAGGVARMNAAGGHLYEYASETNILVKATTAPATGATTGTIKLTVLYSLS